MAARPKKRAEGKRAAIRSEDVTLLRFDDFFASKPIVFSGTFCEKSKKSQPLRMTAAQGTRKKASAPGCVICCDSAVRPGRQPRPELPGNAPASRASGVAAE